MTRTGLSALVALGLAMQGSPLAWAQLETVDPALAVAVEALVTHDPEVAGNPELAALCREVAEASVSDLRERAAIESEAATLVREGVDLSTVIPDTVRTEAQELFAKVQEEMRQELETLRAADPEKAREIELMLREGERQMQAFESGERYTPSAEMVSHAGEMFTEWKETMQEQGASPEFLARAEMEFGHWSSGEMAGPGSMPSLEQMQDFVDAGQMTPEQLQMAKDYMASPEDFMAAHPDYSTFGPEAMGSGGPPGGTWEGGTTWEAGPHEGINEYATMSPTEAFEHWAAEAQNVSPEQMEQYREMAEHYQPPESNYTPPETPEYVPPPSGGAQGEHTLVQDNPPGQPDGWDSAADSDTLPDHTHPEGTAPHNG